ncbi:MAG: hypothetical protein AVDCRST_MAG37-409 [uncultured Rubrobacteraceae bacterium]|uniref:Uncharacterized protein n=1 Tax=uncultured Rubrobacteraceae bacterium TaxID=349277 RepID=A0A6J4PZ10_9ACTN|nr:MAG: hypothetical protein AVDCRST_MAG37-409 [uncultured Rubrobacteraceae bacterium]
MLAEPVSANDLFDFLRIGRQLAEDDYCLGWPTQGGENVTVSRYAWTPGWRVSQLRVSLIVACQRQESVLSLFLVI